MELPDHSKAVLQLGKRLVAELDLGDDLLSQWMAHDIAARIAAVEQAGSDVSASTRDDCMKSILTLWEHRNELPMHLRPFRELEPLRRTLVALDVDEGDGHRYFPAVLREAALDEVEGETRDWLDLAVGLDYSARVLIQFALRSAGNDAVSKAKPWVEAALSAGAAPVAERLVVEFASPVSPDSHDRTDAQQKDLSEKIGKLESFAHLANAVAAELRTHLEPRSNLEDTASSASSSSV